MNRTLEFQACQREYAKSNQLKIPILNTQKPESDFIKKSKRINKKLIDLRGFVMLTLEAYLGVSGREIQGFPSIALVNQMDQRELDQFIQSKLTEVKSLLADLLPLVDYQISIKDILQTSLNEVSTLHTKLSQKRQYQQNLFKPKPSAKGSSLQSPSATRSTPTHKAYSGWQEDDSESEVELTAEMKLKFESENELLLETLQGNLDQIQHATRSINEIAQMQSTLSTHLQQQSETIGFIDKDLDMVKMNVEKGKEHLVSAKEVFGGPKMWVFWFFFGASCLVLMLDYFYS